MDPNVALAALRDAVRAYEESDTIGVDYSETLDIIECVKALDGWISRGGFLPDDWKGDVPR